MFRSKPNGKRPLSLAVAAAITPVLASTALAQNPQLEEVVVTATKRAENPPRRTHFRERAVWRRNAFTEHPDVR